MWCQIFRIRSPRRTLLQHPDRRVGIHFDDGSGIRIAADAGKQIHRGDPQAQSAGGLSGAGERCFVTKCLDHHGSPCAEIHPSGNFPVAAPGQHGVERILGFRPDRNRGETAGSQTRIVRDQKIADRARAIARHRRWVFPRGIDHLVIEQKNPVLGPAGQRLDQDRVVTLRDLVEIARERGFAVHGLREIAARPEQRLDEGGRAQCPEIAESVCALMPGGTKRATAVIEEEIVAAEGRKAGPFKDGVGEVFVRCQRRGGGAVLRVPGTSASAEVKAVAVRGDAENDARARADVLECQPEFGTGIFRIDRLVRIEVRLSRSNVGEAVHAVVDDLVFRLNRDSCAGRAAKFIVLIASIAAR